VRWIDVRFVVLALVLAACTSAAPPAFRPRPPGRSMATATMLVVQQGTTIDLFDRATGARLPFSVAGELVGAFGDTAVALIEVEMRSRLATYGHRQEHPFISDELPFDIAENGCLLAVEAGRGEVLLGYGSSHSSCDHQEHVQQWVAVDLRTRHVRVVPAPQLAF
jgi:hypothetical protein